MCSSREPQLKTMRMKYGRASNVCICDNELKWAYGPESTQSLVSCDVPRPSTFLAEFAHTQLHSARVCLITDDMGKAWVPRLTRECTKPLQQCMYC